MRAFIVLCLIAVACAEQGYNYQPAAPSYAAPSYAAPSYAAPSYAAPASGPSYGASPAASVAAPSYAAPAGVDKEFYSFSANDQDFLEPASSQQAGNFLNQHLRVIFIKGPEHNGLEDAAVALAKGASDSKTAIYVLNKQADLSELANKLKNSADHSHSKPEVHFVKYRTPEDAANAQQQIQAQYDALGGRSQSYSGGVAPSINFASSPVVHQAAPSAPQGSYLPSSIIKRLRV